MKRTVFWKRMTALALAAILLLGLLPVEAAAYLGDIRPVNSDTVTTKRCPAGRWSCETTISA